MTYRLLEVAVVGAAVRRAVDEVGGIAGVGDATLESLRTLTLDVNVRSGDGHGGGGGGDESEEGGENLHVWRGVCGEELVGERGVELRRLGGELKRAVRRVYICFLE